MLIGKIKEKNQKTKGQYTNIPSWEWINNLMQDAEP